jgi:hypothetical protein
MRDDRVRVLGGLGMQWDATKLRRFERAVSQSSFAIGAAAARSPDATAVE